MGHVEHLKQCAKDGYIEGQQDSWQVNVSQNSLNKLLAAFEAERALREYLETNGLAWTAEYCALKQAADAALRELEGE